MKLATLFCVLAMLFYALETSITDWKLAKVSPRVLTLCYALGVAVCAGVNLLFTTKEQTIPQGSQWIFVFLMIVASFVAASSHFAALHHDSGAVMLTMFYCLMPVAASLFMTLFKQELPGWRVVVAWVIAALALYLVSTGKTGPRE